jgi:hypothetical protein
VAITRIDGVSVINAIPECFKGDGFACFDFLKGDSQVGEDEFIGVVIRVGWGRENASIDQNLIEVVYVNSDELGGLFDKCCRGFRRSAYRLGQLHLQ